LVGWENSTAKLLLDRITAAAMEAAWPDPSAVEWSYECRYGGGRIPGPTG
jgi:hypothetical protein